MNKNIKEIYTKLYENLPVGIELYDEDGFLVDINKKDLEIFGVEDKKDMLSINFWDNANFSSDQKERVKRGEEIKQEYKYDFDLVRKNNYFKTTRTGIAYLKVLYNSLVVDNNIIGYVCCIEDITEERLQQQRLSELSNDLNLALEAGGVAAWIYDVDKKYFNTLRGDAIAGTGLSLEDNFKLLHPDDVRLEIDTFSSLINKKVNSVVINIRFIHPDGTYHYYDSRMMPKCDIQGNVISITGTQKDVTKEILYEKELEEEKTKAQQADHLKSAFLANMSHEIRTPLNSIVGFSKLLCEECSDEEKEKYTSIIDQNTTILLKLIDDILDLAKIESGNMKMDYTPVNISELFEKCFEMFKLKINNDSVKLVLKIPENRYVITTDLNRVLQLVNNFTTNAIKHTKSGTITMGYTYIDKGIKINVTDTGSGISKENQPLVFSRFQKFDTFSTGTGLGLAICKAIIEALNGKIGFESTPCKGTSFWAWIPDKED